MKNLEMKIEGDILTLIIDLSEDFGPSKSGRSTIISSSDGNVLLHDGTGYRTEKLNFSISRPKPRD